MTRSFSMPRLRWLAVAITLAVLAACGTTGTGTKPTNGTAPPVSGSCGGNQRFQLTGAGSMDDPCAFDPVVVSGSHCQLLRVDAEAVSVTRVPPAVIFEKDGASIDRTPNVPSSGTWSATTSNFNCSTGPGCADGTYRVRLSQTENPSLCSDYGSVTLKLVLR